MIRDIIIWTLNVAVLIVLAVNMIPNTKIVPYIDKANVTLDIPIHEAFTHHQSPAAPVMTKAVLSTDKPALLAAVAIVESNGDPDAIGDKGLSKGAFQVQSKWWGDVPDTAIEQAQQANDILTGLLDSRRCLRRALQYYNGGGSGSSASIRYADRVLKLAYNLEVRRALWLGNYYSV